MSFGVMGAHMQAQGHLQMVIRIIAGGRTPRRRRMPLAGISPRIPVWRWSRVSAPLSGLS